MFGAALSGSIWEIYLDQQALKELQDPKEIQVMTG